MKRIPSVALGRHLLVIAGLALASTVGNLSAADTYYVSDHLATTTAVADAAGEIASLEADAFGSPVSGGEQAARYTGKPYDTDIGAYVFPFRNYRSDEARWMSADPSGFPDGSNAHAYLQNLFGEVDPLGLQGKKLLFLIMKMADKPFDTATGQLSVLAEAFKQELRVFDAQRPDSGPYLSDGDTFEIKVTSDAAYLNNSYTSGFNKVFFVAHGVDFDPNPDDKVYLFSDIYGVGNTTMSKYEIEQAMPNLALFDGCGSAAANRTLTYAADVLNRWKQPAKTYLYE